MSMDYINESSCVNTKQLQNKHKQYINTASTLPVFSLPLETNMLIQKYLMIQKHKAAETLYESKYKNRNQQKSEVYRT